jgi:two-component system OmpR family response regulator
MNHEQIIVVDDDRSVRQAIAAYLEEHGYSVRTAADGSELDKALAKQKPDLVILDLMMPGENGLSICQRLKPSGIAILMLSALGASTERIVGLEMGADDYLPKPFDPRELLARVRAVLRRNLVAASGGEPSYLFEGWRYDTAEPSLIDPSGRSIALTQREHRLLRALLERPRRLLTRAQLLDLTRTNEDEPFDRAIDLAISRLRRKLQPSGAELIETVHGGGYRFRSFVRKA